jgi:hypothetical protein
LPLLLQLSPSRIPLERFAGKRIDLVDGYGHMASILDETQALLLQQEI